MRPQLRTFLGLLGLVSLLVACSNDDETAGNSHALTDPMTADALGEYWDAGDDAGTSLAAADDAWATFAALADDPAAAAQATLEAAMAYATACSLASDQLQAWTTLEERINSYGGAKSAIDEAARDAALSVLESATVAALQGGESLLASWQTLGGHTSLRTALADPEGTIPVTGWLAEALSERLQARDRAVLDAIAADDDHGGLLPLDQIPGVDPAGRSGGYADLDDDHPVKLACRAAVPRYDAAERDTSMVLMERAARGSLRWFDAVGAGGSSLADLPEHLNGGDEAASALHGLTLDLRDAASDDPLGGTAVVLIRRLGLPSTRPCLAMLNGVAAQSLLELPAGSYDVVALAAGWARAVAPAATTTDGLVIALHLSHLTDGALLFDGITVPVMGGAGARVDLSAAAASALGDPLDFVWDVQGPQVTSLVGAGARGSFVPGAAGTYTAQVTVSDLSGNRVTDTATIEVKPFAVRVFRTDFVTEQIDDNHFNPGETDTLQLWIANRGATDVVGTPSLTGRHGLDVDLTDVPWTLGAGRQTRWNVAVTIPADYDRDRAYLDFGFTVDGETLVQQLDYRVDFYVELDFIRSPQTSRILTISGLVANPLLETAELVVDRDRDAVYQLPLDNGAFEQVIILPGAEETHRVRLNVSATTGLRREEARAGFMAAVAPADFRATLFWDTNGTDVDLWVTDPAEEKCYYANKTTASGLELDVDDVTGYGPENITGESDLPAGDYLVQVHYYSDHGTDLPSDCTVVLTLHEGTDQEEVTSYQHILTDNQVWDVCIVTWDGTQATGMRPCRRTPLQRQDPTLPTK